MLDDEIHVENVALKVSVTVSLKVNIRQYGCERPEMVLAIHPVNHTRNTPSQCTAGSIAIENPNCENHDPLYPCILYIYVYIICIILYDAKQKWLSN